MKLRLLSIAALAAVAGQAQALTVAQIASARTAGTLVEVHMSGASALSATIGGLFTQNCVAGTLDIYKSDKTDTAFPGDSSDGQSVNAYTCQLIGASDFGAAFNNKLVVFQKSDQGGSGNGVFPVATNQALPFLSLTAADCNTTTKVCKSNGLTKRPDGGVSDVSPIGFNPSQNRPLAPIDFSNAANVKSADFQQVKSVIQTVFGLAVSQPLYDALVAEQGLAAGVRPSVSKAVIGSMLSASYDIGLGWKPLLPNNANNASQVNICRRVNGSGTQTSANRFFLEYGANLSSLLPSDNANNSDNPGVNALTEIGTAGAYVVYEGSSTSNVRDCLAKANDVNAFAIGHVSLENAETAKWKFVKIDGVEPSRDNAKKGLYSYVFESTIQVNKAAAATPKAFMVAFTNAAAGVANLNALPAATQNGVMALPFAAGCPADFGTAAAGSAADKFCSRMTRPNPADLYTVAK